MKTTIACVGFLLVGSWLLLSVWLLGYFELDWLPLKRPATSAEFGDSIGAINGLFSSLAVLLALVAVLIQGRELKASTQAQNDQAQALRDQLDQQRSLQQEQTRRSEAMLEQLKHQQTVSRVTILQSLQAYHASEIARMDGVIERIKGGRERNDLFENCVSKKNKHIAEQKKINQEIEGLS